MEKFKIYLKIGTASKEVFPIYGDDIKIEKKRESDQIFLRESVSGTFSFVRDDFDFIESCGMNTTITMEIYRGNVFIGSREFTKADCTFNYDDKICEVQITTIDKYEKILKLMDNEYNLVSLAPSTQNITMQRRAILQFYVHGDNKVTNVTGNMAYEVSSSTPENPYTYHFSPIWNFRIFDIPSVTSPDGWIMKEGTSEEVNVAGRYIGIMPFQLASAQRIYRTDGEFYLDMSYRYNVWYAQFYTKEGVRIINKSIRLMTDMYLRLVIDEELSTTGGVWANANEQPGPSDQWCGDVNVGIRTMYSRVLTGVQTSYPRNPETDMVKGSDNYKYIQATTNVIPTIQSLLSMSAEVQDAPTKWGTNSEGKYFVEPPLTSAEKTNGDKVYAIAWNMWLPTSFWFHSTIQAANQLAAYDTTWQLKDAYPVHSAISRLLEKIDNTITFGNGDNYSIFLNQTGTTHSDLSTNYPNFMRSRGDALFITPITNAKKTFYEQAAQKGNLTLKNILDMLRNVFRCYWWIDDNRRLRIEHRDYFRKGKTYGTQIANIEADLTALECPSVGKRWGFALNSASYDNSELVSRYEFGWADNCTEQFNGYPIDLTDKFVKEGKESVDVDAFFADIDYAIAQTTSVTDDTYALIEAHRDNSGNYGTQVVSVRMGSQKPIFAMQNGCLSFMYSELNYYLYDLSGNKAKADDVDLDVIHTKRFKKQSVSFPITLQQFRTDGLIKTDLGTGEIESISYSLDSGIATAEVLQDIDVDYSEGIAITISRVGLNRVISATNSRAYSLKVTYAYTQGTTILEMRSVTIAANTTVTLFSESIARNHGAIVVSAYKL